MRDGGAARSSLASTAEAVAELHERLRPPSGSLVVFFVGHGHAVEAVSREASARFTDCEVLGCSTAGSLDAPGPGDAGLEAWVLPPPARASAIWVPDLVDWRYEDARPLIRRLARRLGRPLGPGLLLLVVTHRGGGAESRMLASLAAAAPGVPLVGGGAGPLAPVGAGGTFVGTRAGAASALVCLIEPQLPFHPFACHHFEDSERRFVVTAARPERALLDELSGRPARQVFEEEARRILGDDLSDDLTDEAISSSLVQLGFRASGGLHVRAVLESSGDSLRLAAPVAEGVVLRVVRAGDLVRETLGGIRRARAQLAAPGEMLLFSCLGRRLQAAAADLDEELARTMRALPAGGMACMSEHFGALQVNYTLTGVVFSQP